MTNNIAGWNGQIPVDVLLDSGVLYIGTSIFTGTVGGVKYDPGLTRRQIAFDGQRSGIAGLDRTVNYNPTLSATIIQVPSTKLLDLEPGATTVTITGGPSGATQIQSKPAGSIYVIGDYITDLKAIWMRTDYTFFQVRFPKAVCTKWAIAGTDKEEGKYDVAFEARLDMSVTGQLITNPPVVYEYFANQP